MLVNNTNENVYIYKLTDSVTTTSIKNNKSAEIIAITASPNPFNCVTTIHIPASLNKTNASLQVLDIQGKIVADLTTSLAKKSVEFNAEGLIGGIYIIQLKTDEKIFFSKIAYLK